MRLRWVPPNIWGEGEDTSMKFARMRYVSILSKYYTVTSSVSGCFGICFLFAWREEGILVILGVCGAERGPPARNALAVQGGTLYI